MQILKSTLINAIDMLESLDSLSKFKQVLNQTDSNKYQSTLSLLTQKINKFIEHCKSDVSEIRLCLSCCSICYIYGISFDRNALRSLILDVNDLENLEEDHEFSSDRQKNSNSNSRAVPVAKIGVLLGHNKRKRLMSEMTDASHEPEVPIDMESSLDLEPHSPDSDKTNESPAIHMSHDDDPFDSESRHSDVAGSKKGPGKSAKINCQLTSLALVTAVICDILPSKKDENILWKLFTEKLKDFVIENLKNVEKLNLPSKLAVQNQEKSMSKYDLKQQKKSDHQTTQFVEFILLLAIHLKLDHRKKVEQILLNHTDIVDSGIHIVCKEIVKARKRKLIIKNQQISNLAYYFNFQFSNEALAEFITSLPVTKNLSGGEEAGKNQSGNILPIDLVIPVLLERQNLSKSTTNWVFNQILNSGHGPIHKSLIQLVESFVDSCLKPPHSNSWSNKLVS